MNGLDLALGGVRAWWRSWLGVFVAAALSSALIGAALGVGDALRAALAAQAAARVGPVASAVRSPEHLVRAAWAAELAAQLEHPVAGAMTRTGVASSDTAARPVTLVGVTDDVGGLAPGVRPPPGVGRVGARLAATLGVRRGDRLVVRVERPSGLPRDVALTQEEGRLLPLAVNVEIVEDAWPARYAWTADPAAPDAIVVSLDWMQARLARPGEIDTLWTTAPVSDLSDAVARTWRAADAGLRAQTSAEGDVWVSERVALRPAVAEALAALPGARPASTWFLEGIGRGEASVPYAFVTTEDALGPDDVVLVEETARRLGVEVGQPVVLRYPEIGRGRGVAWRDLPLRVAEIVPDGTWGAAWTPPIEGLSGRAQCRDWNPGLPLDLGRIGDADEAWWSAWGAAPRAAIAAETAAARWGGGWAGPDAITGVRVAPGWGEGEVTAALRGALRPAQVGLEVRDVASSTAASARPSNDFGLLFLGFQSVLLVCAWTLAGLNAALLTAQRRGESALLRAMGWSARRILLLGVAEAAVVAGSGAVVGCALSVPARAALLDGLAGVWRPVLGSLALAPAPGRTSAAIGAWAAWAAVVGATAWGGRGVVRAPSEALAGPTRHGAPAAGRGASWAAAALVTVSVLVALLVPAERTPAAAGAFFGAGAAALAGLVVGVGAALQRPVRGGGGGALVRAGWAAQPSRARAVVGTLGGGVLLVAGVGLGAGVPADALAERSSGSGGFASVIELVVPWVRSVGADGETWVGAPPAGVVVHEVFVRLGDDASCLQLGQAQTPHVYGVPSAAWGARGTFTVASGAGWEALAARTASGRVPALGDTQTLTWGLRLGVGDVLTLSDDDGAPLELEIVGVVASSFLQGGLIIDAALWREAWPSEAGARMWAVEGPREAVDAWVPGVLDRLQDHGATAESASARMERFLVVEHTYLAVFRALGGLGLALAGLGAAVVLARAAVERSDELSLLRALGFSRARIVGGLVMEHGALVLLGVTAGLAAAVVAAWPALSAPDAHPEWGAVWAAVAACAVGGLAALGVVATWLVRGDPGR